MTFESASAARDGQLESDDGRVELQDTSALTDPALTNEDLMPVPVAQRNWHTYNYAALWVGMSHNIPSWLLASGLVAAGMSWQQAVFIILLANVIVLIPILLNGHGGTKYGIPFPVLARSSFGIFGANLPALIRALAATCWFGVQTWIGGEGIFLLAGKMFGDSWENASHIGDFAWTQWLSFILFWLLEIAIIIRGIDTLKHFENWAAPVVLVAAVALLIYMWIKAGGVGDILSQSGTLHGHDFWKVFGPSLMGMIGFWATLSLNISDFTRFGGSQKKQMLGQTYGLPTTMTFFALLSVFVTSASEKVYGEVIWDPIKLAARIDNWVGTLVALATVMVATLAVNIAANLVSPSYDFANAVPKHINFRRGALLTCVLSVLIMPWKLVSDPNIYIFTWLNFVGAILGPVAGILLADYWFVRRKHLVVRDLYTRGRGLYWYRGGWNWIAVVSFAVAAILAGGGSYSGVDAKGNKTGPFPVDGMIPILKDLADYGWIIGLVAGAVIHTALMKLLKAPVSYDDSAPNVAEEDEGVTV